MTRESPIRRNLFELNASLGVRAVARLASAVLLVDRLGMNSYGKMAWALTLTYVSVGDDLGLANWATRAAARDAAWYRPYVTGFLAVSGAITGLRVALVLLFLPLVCPDPETRALARIFVCSSLISAFSLGWLHFARERMTILRNVTVARELAWLAGVIVLVHSPADLMRLPWLLVACEVLSTGVLNWAAFAVEGLPERKVRLPSFRDVASGAVPVWVGSRVFHLRPQLGTLVIGATAGSSAVAVFDLGWRVAYNVWLIGATSGAAVGPALFIRGREAAQTFWTLLQRSLRIAWMLALLPPALALAALRPLLFLFLGAKSSPVVLPMQLLLVLTVPAILRGLLRHALFALGRHRALAVLAVVDIAMLGPALALARLSAAVGLASTVLAIEVTMTVGTAWALFGPKLVGAVPVAWRAVLAGAAAYAASLAAGALGAIFSVVAGAIVYLVVIWLVEPASRVALELLLGARSPTSPSG